MNIPFINFISKNFFDVHLRKMFLQILFKKDQVFNQKYKLDQHVREVLGQN